MRWSDLDAQGHINNALLVSYLQEARVALFSSGAAASLLEDGVVVVSHQVQYRRAMSYAPGGVLVRLGVSQLGGSRFEIAYDVLQQDEVVAQARTVLCPIDFATGRPRRLTPAVRDHLEEHLGQVEPFPVLEAPPLDGRGHRLTLPVRWTDLDRYAHVNNTVVFDYIQEARVAAIAACDPSFAEGRPEHLWFVARQDVDYPVQIGHGEVEVRLAPARLGNSSVSLVTEVEQGSRVCVRARTVVVCADLTGRPVRVPEPARVALGSALVS